MSPYKYHLTAEKASPISTSCQSHRGAPSEGNPTSPAPPTLPPARGRPSTPRSRAMAESIVTRAEFLALDERLLMQSIYQHGRPVSEVAALSACPITSIRARVRQILRRIWSPEFAFVAVHQDE